jgi:hypothetical protein
MDLNGCPDDLSGQNLMFQRHRIIPRILLHGFLGSS